MTDQTETLIDTAIDGVSYADNAALSVSSSVRAVGLFLCNFRERPTDLGLASAARDRLVDARKHAEDALRLIAQAEHALEEIGEPPQEEQRLNRVAIDMALVKSIPQQPQVQTVLNDQLRGLMVLASKFGLYDAGDYIRRALAR